MPVKFVDYRPNDFVYDPIFTVSSEKDFLKEHIKAKLATVQFEICPIFQNMFSEMNNYPNQEVVIRQPRLPHIFKRITKIRRTFDTKVTRIPDIRGKDRCKFFDRPRTPVVPRLQISGVHPCEEEEETPAEKKLANKKIQTLYRESSAQTSPWQPDYVLMNDCDPEILKLDFLEWGRGLPAGLHEVELIQRARMKRKWEEAMPPPINEANMKKRTEIIKAIEIDAWAYREQEIQDIQDLRLELLEKMLNELHEKSKQRATEKLNNFCKIKETEKNEKITKLRHKTQRELRKLRLRKEGISRKYKAVNIIEEHANRKSELYGPQMRHGERAKRWHEVINNKLKTYKPHFSGIEKLETLPKWLDKVDKEREPPPKLPGTRLCVRENKWTTPYLKTLYEQLKGLRTEPKIRCNLRQKIHKPPETPLTPDALGIDDEFEELFQSTILLQKVLRGRASQILIFEGRDTCRELIRELRTTHGLKLEQKLEKHKQRLEVMEQQRDRRNCQRKIGTVQEDLTRLSGSVVGTLLDFLNKALQRLLDERKAHALCLYAERERSRREAAEAGRRQKELRRLKEHDEMFKQVVKIHQETVDLYLQDIIAEGMEFASEDEARFYITKLANEIDDEAYRQQEQFNVLEEEELISDLFHNFILPDVEKRILRDKMRKRQQERLKTVHNEVYSRIETFDWTEEEPTISDGMLKEILEYLEQQEVEVSVEEENQSKSDTDICLKEHRLLLEVIAEEQIRSEEEEKEPTTGVGAKEEGNKALQGEKQEVQEETQPRHDGANKEDT